MNQKPATPQSAPQSQMNTKLYQQLTFTFGVFWVSLSAYLAGAHPEQALNIFTFKSFILLPLRAYIYCSNKNKYFMWDFCYFANLLILFHLYVMPDSLWLFKLLFACSLGPLSWAVVTWRNSLVFHSLDKITSVFIHLGPPLLMYELRWMTPNFILTTHPEFNHISWSEAVFYPMCFYFLWQVYYTIRIDWLTSQTIEENDMWTSFRYMTSDRNRDTWMYRICHSCGPKWSRPIYKLVQAGYTTLTLLPVKFIYEYQLFHFLFYMGMYLVCIWNGATFYFNQFSKQLNQTPFKTQ